MYRVCFYCVFVTLLFSCKETNVSTEEIVTATVDSTVTIEKNRSEEVIKDTVETVKTFVDTVAVEKPIDLKEKWSKRIQQIDEESNLSENKKYVEDLEVDRFFGEEIEAAAIEITTLADGAVLVTMDYFEMAPLGLRRFYIEKGNLFCVKTFKLQTTMTEKGEVVVEENLHTAFYQDNTLEAVYDKKGKHTTAEKLNGLQENLRDWGLIQPHL